MRTDLIKFSLQKVWEASLKYLESKPPATRTLLLYILIPYLTSLTSNLIVSSLSAFLDTYAPKWFWLKYKILYKDNQRTQYPFMEVLKQSAYAQLFLLASSGAGAVLFPRFLQLDQTVPGILAMGRTMFLMSLVDDLWFYINHRTLHRSKWLWENVHSLHHKMMNPTALSTNYLHPLEMLLVSIGTIAATVVVRPHYVPFIFFIFIRTAEDVGNHSGWDFPFLPSHYIPGHVTARFHDTHHALSNYQGVAKNLATTYTIWDRMFGTFSKGFQKKKVGGDVKRVEGAGDGYAKEE
ncbi:hypothetical protein HDU97_001502 [Phlyctochytrium planicorne]|nr:hypothetical protein HDU97_001502 [Phlyctochytrium planicorne]